MKIKIVIGSVLLVLLYGPMAVAQWPQFTLGNNPSYEFELGTRILDRQGAQQGIPLVTENLTMRTLFTSGDATDLSTSAGADVRFSRTTNHGTQWEFRGYFNHWDNFVQTSGDLRSPLVFGVPLSNVDYTYDSDLYNVELNFKRAIRPGVTVLWGPRFLSLQEFTQIEATIPNGAPSGGDLLVQTDSSTNNPMIGAQIGAEIRQPVIRDVFAMGFIKGGIFGTPQKASVQTQLIDTGFIVPVVLANTSVLDERATHATGIVEFGGRVHHDIVPGHISFYVGYEAAWIDGVTLGPPQILSAATPSAPSLHNASTPFMQGIVIGGTVRH